MREELLTVKMAVEEYPEFTTQKINFAIRQGALKAKKIGTKYYFTREALNQYLGIDNRDSGVEKDLEIARLKHEVEKYKSQITMFRDLLLTCKGILG